MSKDMYSSRCVPLSIHSLHPFDFYSKSMLTKFWSILLSNWTVLRKELPLLCDVRLKREKERDILIYFHAAIHHKEWATEWDVRRWKKREALHGVVLRFHSHTLLLSFFRMSFFLTIREWFRFALSLTQCWDAVLCSDVSERREWIRNTAVI